jgi:hypothetical protein
MSDGAINKKLSQRLSYVENANFFEPNEGHTKSYPYLKQPAVYRNRIARVRRYFKNWIAAKPDEIMRASDIHMENEKLRKFYSYGNALALTALVLTSILI